MRRGLAGCDPALALRLRLGHVSQTLPVRPPRNERSLASIACSLHMLGGLLCTHLCLDDIFMGCFLHWAATGVDHQWLLSAL